ncbi:helix-turn-helix domain-containing protein [Nonomuraea sp. 10N515B]|uniref:helix-turn-helix domain-containing protein n=1 Tax=Nonomuraea sp. 10N515B TaxID=3457422 RepID=UPI003FCEC888
MADLLEELLTPEELAVVRQRAARRVAGLRLGEIRKRLGLTQKDVADHMGVTQRRVSAIEGGNVRDLKVSTLLAYAKALGGHAEVSVDVDGLHLELTAGETSAA